MHIETSESCCGLQEIHELRAHPRPEEAMKLFIEYWKGYKDEYLYNLFLFTGVEYITVPQLPPNRDDDTYVRQGTWDNPYRRYQADHAYWERNNKTGYAGKFASFIRKHKLGCVTSLKAVSNPNHPTHFVRGYLWTPDWKALRAWYTKQKTGGSL